MASICSPACTTLLARAQVRVQLQAGRVSTRLSPALRLRGLYGVTARPSAASGVSRVVRASAASSPTSTRIIIQGRNLEVTPAIRGYCEDKVTKAVAHFEGHVKSVEVKLSVRGGDAGAGPRQQRTEITAYTLRHGVVRAEDVEDSLYASVDLVCDKVQRSLRKIKEKAVDNGTWPGRGGRAGQAHLYEVLKSADTVEDAMLDRFVDLAFEAAEPAPQSKMVDMEPMTLDEAIVRLEAERGERNFFVFMEVASNTLQVVYRKKDNGFGVIIPQRP